jgi:hypothetical protein
MDSVVVTRNGQWRKVQSSVSSADQLCASANLILLVKNAADTLEKHFPGWMWALKPDEAGGIIDIMSLRISAKRGYTLHTKNVQEDVEFKLVMRAGGELLERYGFRRGRYSQEEWHRRELVMGQFIPDLSDQSRVKQRNMRTDITQAAVVSGHAKIITNDCVGAALRLARA